MEFGLKGTSRVCRGRHGEVGIVEFGLIGTFHEQAEVCLLTAGVLFCEYFLHLLPRLTSFLRFVVSFFLCIVMEFLTLAS